MRAGTRRGRRRQSGNAPRRPSHRRASSSQAAGGLDTTPDAAQRDRSAHLDAGVGRAACLRCAGRDRRGALRRGHRGEPAGGGDDSVTRPIASGCAWLDVICFAGNGKIEEIETSATKRRGFLEIRPPGIRVAANELRGSARNNIAGPHGASLPLSGSGSHDKRDRSPQQSRLQAATPPPVGAPT